MNIIDPRYYIIQDRLKSIRRIIGFASNKGGVGKSVIAVMTSIILSNKGFSVGLFDTDFTNPSCHIILHAERIKPVEDKGIIPPKIHKVKLMSITYYTGDKPLPLRGADITNTILELLAITRWGSLDFLVVDLPPGLSDEILDVIRFIKEINIVIVTTPSKLSLTSVSKLVKLLKYVRKHIVGVIVNEVSPTTINLESLKSTINSMGVKLLGVVGYDPLLEYAIGDYNRLMKTKFKSHVERVVDKILELV